MVEERARRTIRSIAKRIVESRIMRTMKDAVYDQPESVGRIKVREVITQSEEVPLGLTKVRLDFPELEDDDESQWIYKVPKGWIEGGQSAEIIVRKVIKESLLSPIDNWVVAIRPYDVKTYAKPVETGDKVFHDMFFANMMNKETHRAFYEKFIHDRNLEVQL